MQVGLHYNREQHLIDPTLVDDTRDLDPFQEAANASERSHTPAPITPLALLRFPEPRAFRAQSASFRLIPWNCRPIAVARWLYASHPIHMRTNPSAHSSRVAIRVATVSIREISLGDRATAPPTMPRTSDAAQTYPCSFAKARSLNSVSTRAGSDVPSGYSACTRRASSAAASAAATSPTPR